jgi:hypothetical protein
MNSPLAAGCSPPKSPVWLTQAFICDKTRQGGPALPLKAIHLLAKAAGSSNLPPNAERQNAGTALDQPGRSPK